MRQLTYYVIRLYSLDRSTEALVIEVDASRVGVRKGS